MDNFNRTSNAIMKEADVIQSSSEVQTINQSFCDHHINNITTRIQNLNVCIHEVQDISVLDYI